MNQELYVYLTLSIASFALSSICYFTGYLLKELKGFKVAIVPYVVSTIGYVIFACLVFQVIYLYTTIELQCYIHSLKCNATLDQIK